MKQANIFRFLKWFSPDHLYEEIEGDLIQKFERDVRTVGEKKAKRKLMWNTIRFFRFGIILRNNISTNSIANSMIKNHLLFTIRLLSRNKAFVLVSIFGLSISIAASTLLVDYARFELSYDRFFSKHKDIYRLQHNRVVNGELLYKKAMNLPEVGMALKEYFAIVLILALPVFGNGLGNYRHRIFVIGSVNTLEGELKTLSFSHKFIEAHN